MNWWSLIIGILLYGLVMFDIFKTTLSLHGGGPISKGIMVGVSRLAYQYRRRFRESKGIKYLGLLLILSLLFSWFLLQLFSLSFILYADPMAVINSNSRLPADFWERVYFAGTAITTVGFGDWVAGTNGWRLFTILIAGSGLISISMAISYLVPVLQAVIQKRQTSNYLVGLGSTPESLLRHAWNGEDFSELSSHFASLATLILQHARQHQAYPIIHYIHGGNRKDSFALNLAALDEALTILLVNVPREQSLNQSHLYSIRNAVTTYLDTLSSAFIEPSDEEPPPTDIRFLEELGITPIRMAFGFDHYPELGSLHRRRRLLQSLVDTENMEWQDIYRSYQYEEVLDIDFSRLRKLKTEERRQQSLFDDR